MRAHRRENRERDSRARLLAEAILEDFGVEAQHANRMARMDEAARQAPAAHQTPTADVGTSSDAHPPAPDMEEFWVAWRWRPGLWFGRVPEGHPYTAEPEEFFWAREPGLWQRCSPPGWWSYWVHTPTSRWFWEVCVVDGHVLSVHHDAWLAID